MPAGRRLERTGARAGDRLYVSGPVGDAAVDRARTLTGVSRGGLRRTRVTSRGAVAEAIRAGLDDDLSHFSVEG